MLYTFHAAILSIVLKNQADDHIHRVSESVAASERSTAERSLPGSRPLARSLSSSRPPPHPSPPLPWQQGVGGCKQCPRELKPLWRGEERERKRRGEGEERQDIEWVAAVVAEAPRCVLLLPGCLWRH